MSADASLRYDETGWRWTAVHDGPCKLPDHMRHDGVLSEVIREVEACLDHVGGMRWEMATLKDGNEPPSLRLRGYIW